MPTPSPLIRNLPVQKQDSLSDNLWALLHENCVVFLPHSLGQAVLTGRTACPTSTAIKVVSSPPHVDYSGLMWADNWSKTTLWNSVHLNIYIQHVLHSARSSWHPQTQDWNCNGIHGDVISKNNRESIWVHPPKVKYNHQSRKWHHHVQAGATSYLCLVCQSLKLSCRIYSYGGY